MRSIGESIVDVLRDEFGTLFEPAEMVRVSVRLLVAAILGGILGFEREWLQKPAGLRTHMLVALGSALFVLVPLRDGMELADLSRVIQGVVTGIGFIGGGAILKQSEQGEIKGLTTATSIWLTTAIGIAVGIGRLGIAIFGVVLALLILSALQRLERKIGDDRAKR
jgi:putative Mg2+ transporter-C (MgtC) family protein